MSGAWLQLKLTADKTHVEVCETLLLELGALSITLADAADQPILEPELGTAPIWDNTHVIGLFDGNTDSDALQDALSTHYQVHLGQPIAHMHIDWLEDKDWVRAWMDSYEAMSFGSRLWVCPSWQTPPQQDATNLMLDPGLAFGTGTHPTTALCLSYLDEHIQGGEHIIDYGCGSGILGIAALLLGANRMTGVDIDPQALTATQSNAERNHIDATRYQVFTPENTPSEHADVMVANILAGPLTELAPTLAKLTRQGGRIALSGLLTAQSDNIRNAYTPWFDLAETVHSGDWILIHGRKR